MPVDAQAAARAEPPYMIAAEKFSFQVFGTCLVGMALMAPATAYALSPDQDRGGAPQESPQDVSGKPIAGVAKQIFPADTQYRIGITQHSAQGIHEQPVRDGHRAGDQ